jgi:hypothetical protein
MKRATRADSLLVVMRAHISAVIVLSVLTACMRPLWAQAQSLGDLARQEEERRKTIKSAAKVYTNKDLGNAQPPPAARPSTVAEQGAAAGAAAALASVQNGSTVQTTIPAGQAADPEKDRGVPKDQAYWAGRMKELNSQLGRDETYESALQTQVNSLTTDFINRDDPAQRATIEQNRQKALGELARLQKEVDQDKKAIADLEEEARRAGAPPGWLR